MYIPPYLWLDTIPELGMRARWWVANPNFHLQTLIALDWIVGLEWIGLEWIGLEWIALDWIGLDWIG